MPPYHLLSINHGLSPLQKHINFGSTTWAGISRVRLKKSFYWTIFREIIKQKYPNRHRNHAAEEWNYLFGRIPGRAGNTKLSPGVLHFYVTFFIFSSIFYIENGRKTRKNSRICWKVYFIKKILIWRRLSKTATWTKQQDRNRAKNSIQLTTSRQHRHTHVLVLFMTIIVCEFVYWAFIIPPVKSNIHHSIAL